MLELNSPDNIPSEDLAHASKQRMYSRSPDHLYLDCYLPMLPYANTYYSHRFILPYNHAFRYGAVDNNVKAGCPCPTSDGGSCMEGKT